jgi:hypothetical protein
MFRIRLAVASTAFAAAAAIAVTACSSSPAPHSPPGPAPSGAMHPPAAATTRQTALACAGLVPFGQSVLTYPGGDSGSTPSGAQLRRWAAIAVPRLQVLAANLPVSLDPDVATVRAMLTTISNGTPVDPTPVQYAALTSFDQWGHGACGFTRLDVTNTAAGLTGMPSALPAGTVSVSFTNRAPAAKAGFILLVGRVRPGAHYTLGAIRSNKVDLTEVADIVVAAQPDRGRPAYATVRLTSGDYVVTSPIGSPPNFSGIAASEFHVR